MIKELLKRYYMYVICVLLLIALCISCFYLYDSDKEEEYVEEITTISTSTSTTSEVITTTTKGVFYVDVKGAVKKPGVYQFQEGDKVIDAIKIAGGLASNAVTYNINLASNLTPEMVIYIFTSKELSATKQNITCNNTCTIQTIEVNNCITTTSTKETTSSTTEDNKLVNINTANFNELMTIPGIGESKAIAIINYRKDNRFNTIEDIKNVSGIGDSLFAKIKDYITV